MELVAWDVIGDGVGMLGMVEILVVVGGDRIGVVGWQK